MIETDTLKELTIFNGHFDWYDEEMEDEEFEDDVKLFANAFSHLDQLTLNHTQLTTELTTALLKEMPARSPKFVIFNGLLLHHVEPDILAKGLSSVPTLRLVHCDLTRKQWIMLFIAILQKNPIQAGLNYFNAL